MLLFLESANLPEIEQALELGAIDGVVTGPILARREGCDYAVRVGEICRLVDGPVCADVTGHFLRDMLSEGEALASIGSQVVVRLPATKPGLRTLRHLAGRGARVNVTLCFSAAQAMVAAKGGAAYVTPFFAVTDEVPEEGMKLIARTRRIFGNYGFNAQIVAAPIRTAEQLTDAAVTGADAAVIGFGVIDEMLNNPRTDRAFRRMLANLKHKG